MPNALNELTDLYESLNLNGNGGGGGTLEDGNNSIDAIMRINSFLNNSLDLRSINADNARKSSIDAMLTELMNGNETNTNELGPVGTPKKNSHSSSVGSSHDPSVPLSRLLAQSYSYSSDSSGTPNTPLTPRSAPQMLSRNSGVFRDDSSPMSSPYSGNRFYNFTYPGSVGYQRNRQSTTSDPGSPTMDEALLMGRQEGVRSPTHIDYNQQNKVNDITIADLVSSLSMNGGGNPVSMNNGNSPHSVSGSGMPGSPMGTMSRSAPTMPSNTLMNMIQQQIPSNTGMSQPNLNNNHLHNNLQNNQALNQLSQLPQGVDLASLQAQLQNAWLTTRILPGLVDGSNLLGDSRNGPSGPLANLLASATDPYSIEKAAKMHRNAAAVCDATCTWSGQLPQRMHKNPTYSCKVFLGGVPWDVTESALKQTFLHFGNIQVEWPGKENSSNPPRGYVYILFEHEKQVKGLLSACSQDFSIGGNYYYKISSRRIRQKEVQVIPWVVSDSNYVRCPSYQLDPAKTVFVGALHGMLSAEGLANIMNDLFGGVVYSGIDTDKHKYPIGSGRVTFNNVQSYRKAVRAAFIEIKTPKFTKKVQVDPYLADSLCQLCGMQQGPYFCRDENCFKYFCRSCWQLTHPMDTHNGGCGHKPLMRNSKLRTQTTLSRVI